MANNNTTFWNLIDSYKISIPIIQRDYAQGREEESEKREKFLNAILKHLNNSEKLHLDFVYGRVKDKTFFPIDGQQRLTTLYLLHWYFALKEKIEIGVKSKLSQFVYDTRISSREFCHCLINEIIEIPANTGDNIFITEIKNKPWYRNKWDTDPTVKAMLIMIQNIHNKFNNICSSSVFAQLVNEKVISFELLDLGSKGFELTDELYIKMNARGKQLTSFENFKANFIQLIDKYYKNKLREHPIKGEISYSGYFSYKIEKEWTDLFWAFRGDETIVDKKFFSFFEFLAQMCYFKKYKNVNADSFNNSFTQYEDIFQDEENILFLFDSLDKLYELSLNKNSVDKQKIGSFFHELNSRSKLFWNSSENSNLFDRVITNVKNEDPRNKILLYGILSFMIKFNTTDLNEELQKIVRVIRNLMQATRQRNETKYNTNIRINNFGSYWLLLEQFLTGDLYSNIINNSIDNRGTQISDPSIENEREKAFILSKREPDIQKALLGLEELEYFGGLIHLLKPEELCQYFPTYLQCFKEILSSDISSSLKLRALVACDFKGIETKHCRMGKMRYFGKNGNWTTILTSESEHVSDCIITLLNKYSQIDGNPESKLNYIIKEWLENNSEDRTWKYYFVKYPEFSSGLNYFVSPYDSGIRLLGTEGSNPLVAYHISPFVLTVCKKINEKNICETKDCYQQFSGYSPLVLKNEMTLTSVAGGWIIESEFDVISNKILNKFDLIAEGNGLLLKETNNRDKIEIAVGFIKEVFKS